jgi:diguanylate cyclase (GGDEF)-like protein
MSRGFFTRADPTVTRSSSNDDDRSPVALIGCDTAGRITSWNRAATGLLGWRTPEVLGRRVLDIVGRDVLVGGGTDRTATRANTSFGTTVDVEVFTDGEPSSMNEVGTELFAVIPSMTMNDVPSGVSPRVHSWAQAAAVIHDMGGVVDCLVIGLIGVAAVNRGYSRSAGDAVLREVDRRLRDDAGTRGKAIRTGGNQFMVVAPHATPPDVELVVRHLASPVTTDLGSVRIACCVGAATGDSSSAFVLLDRADSAMRSATSRGVGAIEHAPNGGGRVDRRHPRLSSLLIDAVARREIGVQFQPIISLKTGRITEFEALARWTSDEMGSVDPETFIEAAEDAGLIHELGRCVLEASLDTVVAERDAGRWNDLRVSVNLSAVQLAHPDLVTRVTDALRSRDLPGSVLQLEVTETRPLADIGAAAAHLRALRVVGVTVAVDDFGTGCANMSYLRDLPVDTIKIDRRFIAGVSTSRADAAVVRSIIAVAEDLRIDVVAEGVESADQHLALVRLGCPSAQGFLYARPRPADELHRPISLPLFVRGGTIPMPFDEVGRLESLYAADVLDTPPDEQYDEIVRSAATLCQVPIALVSLVDADHQWSKAKVGDVPDRVERELSFCAHAICTDELTEVNDARTDRRFSDNPFVTDQHGIRFYAGVPLRNSTGHAYGTLCVSDVVPRTLTDEQRVGLIDLAVRAATLLELRQRTREARRAAVQLGLATEERDAAVARLMHSTGRDPLTGLASRDALMSALASSLDRLRTTAGHVGLLICDVDRFRDINDRWGHKAGDRTLDRIGDRIRSCVRETDTVVRLGADEFAVLMDSPDDLVVESLSRRLLADLGDQHDIAGSSEVELSLSIGVSVGTGGHSGDAMLRAADHAMRHAKSLGGGRAVRLDAGQADELAVALDG